MCFAKTMRKKKKQMKMPKQRNVLCFCICFFLFAFFLVPLLYLWEPLPVSQPYLLYAPRKKAKNPKINNAKIKRKKCDKHAQLHVFFFLVCFTICLFLLYKILFWLLVSMAGAPDINLEVKQMGKQMGDRNDGNHRFWPSCTFETR